MQIEQLHHAGSAIPVYRRRHVKSDGREVFLYASAPPDQPATREELLAQPAASDLRWHPFRREWAIYAAGRQDRTHKPSITDDPLAPTAPGAGATEIPFADFELAVFENRFPSLTHQQAQPQGDFVTGVTHGEARGRCEVVVYTPEATGSLASLTQERRQMLVHAWIDRYCALFDMGCEFVLPFENRGEEVGVTLHHPHGQIYGFGFTPAIQQKTMEAFEEGFDLEARLRDWRSRFEVASDGGMTAFAPPFARFPYEIWIAPLEKRAGPWAFSISEIEAFAALLGDISRRYDEFFGRACPYMLSLHAAPKSAGDAFHFTAQFYPLLRAPDKIKYLASVEQATNVFTVDVLPEQAAQALRAL